MDFFGDHRRRSVPRAPCFRSCGQGITFIGSNDPRVPVGLGWLRAHIASSIQNAHSPTDPGIRMTRNGHLRPASQSRSTSKIWPTSYRSATGFSACVTVRGKDYEVDGRDAALPNAPYPMKGVGPFLHIDKDDRPSAIFDCGNTCISTAAAAHTSCCRSFPRRKLSENFCWGGTYDEAHHCNCTGCCRSFRPHRAPGSRNPIRATQLLSSCRIRPAARPIRSRAYWRRHCRIN